MDKWMDGWMDGMGWMDGWMDACRFMYACMYASMHACMYKLHIVQLLVLPAPRILEWEKLSSASAKGSFISSGVSAIYIPIVEPL